MRFARAWAISAFVVLAALFVTPAPASADYVYTYIPTVSGELMTQATMTVTDAAVASGNMIFNLGCGAGVDCGDSSGWIRFDLLGGSETAAHPCCIDNVNITFNPDGTLSGRITAYSFSSGLVTSGSEFNWSGVADSDIGRCADSLVIPTGFGNVCNEPGYWFTSQALPTAVPEPPSIWIFLSGIAVMIGLYGAARWKS